MNPMDCKQAQNVWSRVMAAQTAALCTNAEKAPEKTARAQQAPAVSITPEQVMPGDARGALRRGNLPLPCRAHVRLRQKDAACHFPRRALSREKAGGNLFPAHRQEGMPKKAGKPLHHLPTPRRSAGSISASFPRASTMKRLPPCPARGLARCANLRSTSAATRRASTSCCKAVSETETRRLPRW